MTAQQTMIKRYLQTQFQMQSIRLTPQADNEILVRDYRGAEMIFSCDSKFNIINAGTGQMIARRTDAGWDNLPSYFG